jgi:Xaa-Pro aminopeptidase
MLAGLPGEKLPYSTWKEQVDGLRRILTGRRRVAMQYSPQCAVPLVSMVDGGTLELVRGAGVEVVSSANLIQHFEARWTQANLDCHLEAGRKVDEIRRDAFKLVGDCLRVGRRVTEFDVQQFFRRSFAEAGLTTEHGPTIAVNENSSNPHYEPTAEGNREIRRGDCLLMDVWAKVDGPQGVYYDITWTGYCGSEPPSAVQNVFATVCAARDRAVKLVKDAVAAKRPLHGYEVDDAARGIIADHGFGQYFTHRTGHSIGVEVHGAGANMDNFETHDERRIIPWTCFSIEPGIYLPEFGIRSEVNVFVGEDAARVTGEIQEKLVTL